MKRIKYHVLLLLLLSAVLFFSGCGLFSMLGGDDETQNQELNTFEFVTDDKMQIASSSTSDYYSLVLYIGEDYQVKTTIDDKLGEEYYLKFSTDDDISGKFTLSEKGFIETDETFSDYEVFSVDVELYKVGVTKRIARKYFIFSLRAGEYANITLINDNLTYNGNTSTYSAEIESGNHYAIAYSVSSNVSYFINFSLDDESYSSFMSVNSQGVVLTTMTGEDEIGKIEIQAIGPNGVLDTVYLELTVKKSPDFVNEFTVTNTKNAQKINDGDVLTLYKDLDISFDVKYNGTLKTNVISVTDTTILELDNANNKLTGVGIGSSQVAFEFAGEQIVITINVIKDKLVSLYATNEGGDFVIVNGELCYINCIFATYESGKEKEIVDKSLINATIAGGNATHKNVTLKYAEDGVEVFVTYSVKFYVTTNYSGQSTAYANKDYFNNKLSVYQPLPNQGTVKMLVIPVWFEDSTVFFNESQKLQILEDIEYTVKGNRPDTELKSLKQYCEAQSYGAIQMDITVSDFYTSSTSFEDYTDYVESKIPNTFALGTNAVRWYFETYTQERFEDYDLNSDGYVDGVILYYGANYYGAENDENKTNAYQIETSSSSGDAFNSLSFCPIGGLYGLNKQNPSTQKSVADLSARYSDSFKSSARTIIHEVGHMFGNVDLYEDQFADERYSPAGSFVMQDRNFGGHDPYHVNRIGWSKPQVYASSSYQLGDKITIDIADFQSSGQNIILTNTWNSSNSLYDEYLIIELFAPEGLNGFDSKVTFFNKLTSGVRLWHVNSLLTDLSDGTTTSNIIDGHAYDLAYSNYNVDSKYDVLHLIRNNPSENYNTNSALQTGGVLFKSGDSFDMETFKSQFVNGAKLDSGEKLGWAFTVEEIYTKEDGSYGAVITLERTDNVRTEFTTKVSLNRGDLETPTGEMEYGDDIFGNDGEFSLVYKLVTPPSVYQQNYPISSNGMCLFASADGNGGYIDLTIKDIAGKQVKINSISITYSRLTNASLSVIVGGSAVEGQQFTPEIDTQYGYQYLVNSNTVRIQNKYSETINHWSVLALYELTIDYTIE